MAESRNAAEEAPERLRAPLERLEADGTYRGLNQAFSGAFGRKPEEVIGRRIHGLRPACARDLHPERAR